MKEQSAAANEVAINMENIEGPHEDEDKSSTPRLSNQQQLEIEGPPKIPKVRVDKSSARLSNQQQLEVEGPPKIPKVPEKNEGPAPICNKINEGPPDLPLDDRDLAYIFNNDKSSTPTSKQQAEGLGIQKVQEMLRNLDKNCFDPRVVSIGPYHHGKDHLKEVQKLKIELARQYCGPPGGPWGSDLYKRVEKVASEARKFYDMEGLNNNIDDKAFTKMMFIDGCFILKFIICLLGEKEHHDMGMNNYVIANVKRDLFLLENQLPYIILKELMKEDEKDWEKRIEKFITICQRLPPPVKDSWLFGVLVAIPRLFRCYRSPPEDKSQSHLHLLDMTRKRFVNQLSATVQGTKTHTSETDGKPEDQRSLSNLTWKAKVLKSMGMQFSTNKTATSSATSDWYFYHPARALKSKGIKFSPNKTGSFSDVKFESHLLVWGVLTLPRIRIDASTKSLLLNLLAFETEALSRRHDDHVNNLADNMQGVVTSYMCFMDSLIDNAEDVMILRTHNVINNCLGNDQLVADLFNQIASNLVPNSHTYDETKRRIQKHCDNRVKKWMAECHHIHFRNPWTLLALFGSLLLITLTAGQTYLAAMQLKQ